MYQITEYSDAMSQEVVSFILSILEGEFGHFGIDRPDLKDIPGYYQNKNGNFWLAKSDGKIIGTIGLINHGSGRGYIKRMAVATEHRGKGVAQKLLATLMEFAKSSGYYGLYLATSENMTAAIRFYEKEGFERIAALPEDFVHHGDSVFFKKSL